MKKKLLLLLPVLGVLGVLVYIGYSGFRKQAWLVYRNSRYNFGVEFPPRWELGPEEMNNAGREMISEDKNIVCYAYGFENALDQTLSEFVDWLASEDTTLTRRDTKFVGLPAIEVATRTPEASVRRSVYAFLDDNTGRGLYCIYGSEEEMKTYSKEYDRMKKSFELTTEDISFTNMHTACATLLAGATVPLKDLQTFLDEDYTEVTITSREDWDQARLPASVKNLEGQGYTCYPMPYKMEPAEETPGMHVIPVVDTVEWQCELEHTDYKYIEKDATDEVDAMEAKGYSCEKQFCTSALGKESSVWLCTK